MTERPRSPGRPVWESGAAARDALRDARAQQRRIGLVPTMGALHAGHLSLVREARRECDFVVVSIFVNPTQFGPQEDFTRYPRNLAADLQLLDTVGVDGVFSPSAEEIYPPGFSTYVQPPLVARRWEGECRPGHFQGVATVVLKLFQLLPADIAYFGDKDFQQLRVIECMTRDLNAPLTIRGCPIVREPDGLAMSSRNIYLSADERRRALGLHRALLHGRELFHAGERQPAAVEAAIRGVCQEAGIDRLDYVALVDPLSLDPALVLEPSTRILLAGHVGKTRLIDNMPVGCTPEVQWVVDRL